MATYTKRILSGSTDGNPIKLAATSTPGTNIHTGPTSATEIDEVWLWATNSHTAAVTVTIEWGGTTDPDNLIVDAVTIEANQSVQLLIPGFVMQGATTAKTIAGFASVTNVVLITGYVNEIAN